MFAIAVNAQTAASPAAFEGIELYRPDGKSVQQTNVRIQFNADSMEILNRSNGSVIKKWSYADIKTAEYSYTKNPRWKTGLGLGAAGVLFPPLWFVAIPLAFTKHRLHWVTVQTGDDFAVLRLNKNIRKIFMPAFETRTSVKIDARGDDK